MCGVSLNGGGGKHDEGRMQSEMKLHWKIALTVLHIPQFAFYMFMGGLFGHAIGGRAGLAAGAAVGFFASAAVSSVYIYYIRRVRKWLWSRASDTRRGVLIYGDDGSVVVPVYPNCPSLAFILIFTIEISILELFVVIFTIILAENNHDAYMHIASVLKEPMRVFYSHYPWLDKVFDIHAQAGLHERKDFIMLSVLLVWLVGGYGIMKAFVGMSIGWKNPAKVVKEFKFPLTNKKENVFLWGSLLAGVIFLAGIHSLTGFASESFLILGKIPRNTGPYSFYGISDYILSNTGTLMAGPFFIVFLFSYILNFKYISDEVWADVRRVLKWRGRET